MGGNFEKTTEEPKTRAVLEVSLALEYVDDAAAHEHHTCSDSLRPQLCELIPLAIREKRLNLDVLKVPLNPNGCCIEIIKPEAPETIVARDFIWEQGTGNSKVPNKF